MNICGHVSLVYVNIRNVGQGTGVDGLSHASTGGFFCCLTPLILRLFHGLGALVVVFHDFSPRKQNYEHATWHLLRTSGFLLFETLTFLFVT